MKVQVANNNTGNSDNTYLCGRYGSEVTRNAQPALPTTSSGVHYELRFHATSLKADCYPKRVLNENFLVFSVELHWLFGALHS